MATTYFATNYASTPAKTTDICSAIEAYFEYDIASGIALIINDVIKLVKIPKGAQVTGLTVSLPDMDAGTSQVLDFGDPDDTDRYVDGTTKGQAAAIVSYDVDGVAGGAPHNYDAESIFQILVAVAPGTGATTGVIKGVLRYSMTAPNAFN